MNFEHVVVFCTCPDDAFAARIAQTLVQERLAACVNRTAAVRSTYAWEGRIADEPEVLLIIKSLAARLPELEMRLKALHPYEVPEIIALPIVGGSGDYLTWLGRESAGPAAGAGETADS